MAPKKIETSIPAEERQKRCFLITPIGAEKSAARQHADWVFYHVVDPLFRERGYIPSRADLISDPFMINDSVFEAITEADICVADLTLLNANVFYELGIRHAIEKPVIHIAQAETAIPFDNAGYRTIFFDRQDYQSMQMLRNEIAKQIDVIEKPEFLLSNPLTQYRGRERMSESADSRDQMIASLQSQVEEQGRILRRLQAAAASSSPRANGEWPNWPNGDNAMSAAALADALSQRRAFDTPVTVSALASVAQPQPLTASDIFNAEVQKLVNAAGG